MKNFKNSQKIKNHILFFFNLKFLKKTDYQQKNLLCASMIGIRTLTQALQSSQILKKKSKKSEENHIFQEILKEEEKNR